jgi:GDP-L-fucose synthase
MGRQASAFVAGADTLIGAAITRALRARDGAAPLTDAGIDLTRVEEVERLLTRARPTQVYMAAGRSAGIAGNMRFPADLMLNNLQVGLNVVGAAHRAGVPKLLYLASSCSYPRACPQPMREERLLSGPLEPTNESYAVAKLAGLKLCEALARQHGARFISGIPANAFGPGDDFHPEASHVIAALIRRMHEAKRAGAPQVQIWGTGAPRREFIYADDLAAACLFVMERYEETTPINLAGGADLSIAELSRAIRAVVGYDGELAFDPSKPDGMPLKALDARKLRGLGWRPSTPMTVALEATYQWYLENQDAAN